MAVDESILNMAKKGIQKITCNGVPAFLVALQAKTTITARSRGSR